jgi:ABC-type multidrug transport system ATPase subunit
MHGPMVTVDRLSVTYQRWGEVVQALTELSLTVDAGEWLMLVGHNGSGKSTLLRVLAGQIVPSAGDIRFHHGSGTCASPAFLLEQNPLVSAAARLTLVENLRVADTIIKHSAREQDEKYTGMLKGVGLYARRNQLAQYLSGGERQLLGLLIASLRPSPVILLDEPLAALDPARQAQCLRLIEGLHKAGRTIIQVTHDRSIAADRGDRVVEMAAGRMLKMKAKSALSP